MPGAYGVTFSFVKPFPGIWRGMAHGSGLYYLKVCSSIHQAYLLLILELIPHGG